MYPIHQILYIINKGIIMPSLEKDLYKNIPITKSLLHDIEYNNIVSLKHIIIGDCKRKSNSERNQRINIRNNK